MSRTATHIILGLIDLVNALQPARLRGKTVANLMQALESRGARLIQTARGPLRFLTSRGRHVAGATDTFFVNEPETLDWIDAIKPGEVLWDIGAAFGQFALYAGKGGVRVIAFEPKATSYGLLVEHVALNGLGDQITPICLALSDKNGMTGLHLSGLAAGEALNTLVGSKNQFGEVPDGYIQPVYATTMDDALALYGLPAPDHIKLDVDGIEDWILRGGPKTLKGAKSLIIEIEGEMLDHAAQSIDPLLAAAGLVEDTAVRQQGSKRNRLFRRPVPQ